MERYEWRKRGLLEDIRYLAKVATRHLTTQPLATHGDHFTHPLDPPLHGDVPQPSLFPEFYGEIVDQHLGPVYWDRQGFPIYASDIEFMRTEFDIM